MAAVSGRQVGQAEVGVECVEHAEEAGEGGVALPAFDETDVTAVGQAALGERGL